jgi:hypothetical protein
MFSGTELGSIPGVTTNSSSKAFLKTANVLPFEVYLEPGGTDLFNVNLASTKT